MEGRLELIFEPPHLSRGLPELTFEAPHLGLIPLRLDPRGLQGRPGRLELIFEPPHLGRGLPELTFEALQGLRFSRDASQIWVGL